MIHPLAARIWRTIRRHALMAGGSRVVVALSGGADSMALVHLLRELEQAGKCSLAGIVHLNHQLRVEADADEQFCRDVAARFGVPFLCEQVDVSASAASRRVSLESAGHTVRHALYSRACEQLNANCVAVGHTRDDQAETFVLRLVRGAGPRGLSGMHLKHGIVIRPMLECSREEVRAFVSERGIAFREDATNADLTVSRNRVRHDVLPALARARRGAVRALARAAAVAGEDNELLDRLAKEIFERLATENDCALELDVEVLRSQPIALVRRVVAMALARAGGGRFVGFGHIQAAVDLVFRGAGDAERCLPGQLVRRTGSSLVFFPCETRKKGISTPSSGTSYRFLLSIPGEVCGTEGWSLSAERRKINPGLISGEDDAGKSIRDLFSAAERTTAVIDGTTVGSPLIVRNWLPGDRFRPFGASGSKKLQDFFTDRKVPREVRRQVPLVLTSDDRIVWVAGQEIAEDFRVTTASSDVVILKLKYWRNGK